jgi:hypothetical protein
MGVPAKIINPVKRVFPAVEKKIVSIKKTTLQRYFER